MKNVTVWKARAARLALLAVVEGAARAQGPNADPRAAAEPGAYQKLDGVWQCHFIEAKSKIERDYYSLWTFKPDTQRVVVFWSPVHKGDTFNYRWDGKQLALDAPRDPPKPNYGIYGTHLQDGGTLVIDAPQFRWKGWHCYRQPEQRWPEDGLQFLDYARYPWLSGLVEDGPSIMKYRDPKQYEEWLKGQPR